MDYSAYKKHLKELIAFKSISTDPAYEAEIAKLVNWLFELFGKNGFRVARLKAPGINDVVFASCKVKGATKTVLVYGHYDVQPASREDGWDTDPFELVEKRGRLFGRGVVDNKGQFLIHLLTVLDLFKKGNLKYNVKFLLEGNEETANPKLANLVKKYKNELATDTIVISDGEITGENPTIDASFRGGFNIKVTYKTANTPVHSGIYGGAIPNAAYELTKTLSKIFDKNNKVAVPHFYKTASKPTITQIANNKSSFAGFGEIKKSIGVQKQLTEKGVDFLTQTGLRPTIQISGIKSGYIGDGFANIVPGTAEVRMNVRTAPTQDYKETLKALIAFLKKHTPSYVELKYEVFGEHRGIAFNTDTKEFKSVAKLLHAIYNKKVLYKNVGGAIPVIVDFKKAFGMDTISIGFGNEDCNMHGVNENFRIDLVKKGLEFSNMFFSKRV